MILLYDYFLLIVFCTNCFIMLSNNLDECALFTPDDCGILGDVFNDLTFVNNTFPL